MNGTVGLDHTSHRHCFVALAGGCDDDGYTGPCSKEERAVARDVVHPQGLKLKFVRDYDEMCVADIPEDQSEAAVKHGSTASQAGLGSCEKGTRTAASIRKAT